MGQLDSVYAKTEQKNGVQPGQQSNEFEHLTQEVNEEQSKIPKGKIIQKEFARTLVKENKWDTGEIAIGENAAICFDAGNVEEILKQEGCKGIRVYYAKNSEANGGSETVVIVGLDGNGNDLDVQAPPTNTNSSITRIGSVMVDNPILGKDPLILEVGGGNKKEQFI